MRILATGTLPTIERQVAWKDDGGPIRLPVNVAVKAAQRVRGGEGAAREGCYPGPGVDDVPFERKECSVVCIVGHAFQGTLSVWACACFYEDVVGY